MRWLTPLTWIGLAAAGAALWLLWSSSGTSRTSQAEDGETQVGAPEPASTSSRPAEPLHTGDPARAEHPNAAILKWRLPGDREPEVCEPLVQGALTGRLTWDTTFQPARDLEVRLTARWLNTADGTPEDRPFLRGRVNPFLMPAIAVTDSLGRFRIEEVPKDRTVFLVVVSSGAVIDMKKVERLPRAGEVTDLGEVLLATRGAVRGRIAGPAKARVRIVDDPIFENALLDPTQHARMLAEASAFAPELFAKESTPGRDRALPFPEASTAASGEFVVNGVRPGLAWLIANSGGQQWRKLVQVEPGKTTDVGTIASERPNRGRRGALGATRFQVFEADGEGLEQLTLAFFDRTGKRTDCAVANSVAYLVGIAPDDVRSVQARRAPGLAFEDASFVAEKAASESFYSVTLKRPGSLRLWVKDARDLVIPGARVQIYGCESPRFVTKSLLADAMQAKPRPDKSLVARNLPRTKVWVGVEIPGENPILHLIDLASLPDQEQVIRARVPTDLMVHTRDRDGRPVPRVEIWASAPLEHGDPVWVGHTDANGKLLVQGAVRDGLYFGAIHPDFATSPGVAAQDRDEVVIVMTLPVRVTGFVTERGEQPVATWMVLAKPGDQLRNLHASNPFVEARIVPTNADGSFALDGLLPGTWILTAAHPHAARLEVDLTKTGHHHQPIELDPASLYETAGRVTVDGIHGFGLVIRLTSRAGLPTHDAQHVSQDGTFAFPHFPSVPCTLRIERQPRGGAPAILYDQELDRPPRDLAIAIVTGSVSLTVLAADGAAVPRRELALERERSAIKVSGISDERGNLFFAGVPVGRYRLSGPDLRKAEWIEVRAAVTTQKTVSL